MFKLEKVYKLNFIFLNMMSIEQKARLKTLEKFLRTNSKFFNKPKVNKGVFGYKEWISKGGSVRFEKGLDDGNCWGYQIRLKSSFFQKTQFEMIKFNDVLNESKEFKIASSDLELFENLKTIRDLKISITNSIIKEEFENKKKEKEKEKRIEDSIKNKLNKSISKVFKEFDKDGNGELDTIEVKDDFDKLVKKHQSKIIETDRSYIQHFVKVSNYQKQKRKNLQSIFESISKTKNQKELSSQVELLKEQIHSYELLLFHSLNMVTSLVEDNMFTFYEIYESFDKLEIFNSNHENEVSKRLKNIEGGIGKLIISIRQMEESIIDELGYLSYVTQDSYNQLSNNVTRELESIGSSIRTNNLLTGINAYQTYKLRIGK